MLKITLELMKYFENNHNESINLLNLLEHIDGLLSEKFTA